MCVRDEIKKLIYILKYFLWLAVLWYSAKYEFLQAANVAIKRSVQHLCWEWNMPSLRVSHLEIVSSDGKDRSQRAAWRLLDAAFVFSSETSGRKCTLYRLPICYSIKQITGMQFKVVSSQSRLREFRAISHGSIHIHIYIHATYICVCMCIYIYIRFQFLFSGRVRLFTSQGNVVAAQPRFVVSVVSFAVRCRK